MSDLKSLSTALAKATETRDTFTNRLPGAEAALAAAIAHRQSLVQQTTRGADLAPKVMKDAGLATAAAEDALTLIKEQITEATAAYDAAKSAHDDAVQAAKLHAVAEAQRAVINASDRLAHYGAGLTTAAAELTENYQKLFAALHAAGRAPTSYEMQAWQGLEERIPGAVPVDFQNRIIAGGSARPGDVAQFERSTWLAGALPDPEADSPYNEKMRALAEKISAQQAFDAASQADAARRAHPGILSFTPTDMGPSGQRRTRFDQ